MTLLAKSHPFCPRSFAKTALYSFLVNLLHSFMWGYGNLADTSMTCFVSLPGFLLLADWTVAVHTRAHEFDNPFFYEFAFSLVPCLAAVCERKLLLVGGCRSTPVHSGQTIYSFSQREPYKPSVFHCGVKWHLLFMLDVYQSGAAIPFFHNSILGTQMHPKWIVYNEKPY